MKNLQIFCLSLNPLHKNLIDKLGYTPVGLGSNIFSESWLSDKSENNISLKNQFYGEYTFHYWLWKNHLDKLDEGWFGFCQYRKFWGKNTLLGNNINIFDFKDIVKTDISNEDDMYESIIGTPIHINQFKL